MQQGSTNARHRKRTTLTGHRRNPPNDGLRKITPPRAKNGNHQQQQPQQRPHRAAFSSFRICQLFRMIQLRLLQRTTCPRRKFLACFLGLFLVVFIFILIIVLQPLHVFFWGDGYHVEGGVWGRLVDYLVAVLCYDRYSRRRYHHHAPHHHDASVVEYPIVVKLRSNRKEVPGYSRYLEAILTTTGRHIDKKKLATDDWYPKNITTSHASLDTASMHGRIQEWNVDIQEQVINENSHSSNASKKVVVPFRSSVVDRLRKNGCQPGWICHRCLAVPWWGSLDQCAWVCPSCFSSLLCHDNMSSFQSEQRYGGGGGGGGENASGVISIHAHVIKGYVCDGPRERRHMIPRIVHVVDGPLLSSPSSSPLDLLQFPELVRIQNGWRAAGYSYRFYTSNSARAFVMRHYPRRFLLVYEALQSSSPLDQQHFFRLLVLFQQGGIVANADLMLEVNPDALFWTAPTSKDTDPQQHVSFVATIDADMDECLWDGLIAARPGHALVARAIELFYNSLVVQRLDQLEWMKSSACHVDTVLVEANNPLWKVRDQNHDLVYHGNVHRRGLTFCMLGLAVHQAQGLHASWINTPFQPGIYTIESHHCTTKTSMTTLGGGGNQNICKDEGMRLLMMSRDDTGATRLTDMDRNLLIASTDILGVTLESMNERANRVFRKHQDGGVTANLRDAIASNKILDTGIPIKIHIRSEEAP